MRTASEDRPFCELFPRNSKSPERLLTNRLDRGCVVFGRVAGDSASAYLFKEISKTGGSGSGAVSRLNQVNGHLSLPSTTISVDPNSQQVFLTINYGQGQGASSSSATSDDGIKANGPSTAEEPANEKQAATPPKENKDTGKEYTMEEVGKHNKKDDCWVSLGKLRFVLFGR